MTDINKIIVDNVPFPFAVMDKGLNYVRVNSHYLRLIKKEGQNIIGKNIKSIIPSETYVNAKPYFEKALSGEACDFTAHDSGLLSIKQIDVSYIPLPHGGFLAVFGEDRVQQKYFKKGVDSIVITLNHYINNALTVLLGKVHRIQRLNDINEVKEDLKNIQEAALRVTSTLKSISNYEDLNLESYSEGHLKEGQYFKID